MFTITYISHNALQCLAVQMEQREQKLDINMWASDKLHLINSAGLYYNQSFKVHQTEVFFVKCLVCLVFQ